MLSTIGFQFASTMRRRNLAIAVAVVLAAAIAVALLMMGGAEQLTAQPGDEVVAGASWSRHMMMLGASWS